MPEKLFFCHHWLGCSIIMGRKKGFSFISKGLLLGKGRSFALIPSFQKILFPQKILRNYSVRWNYSVADLFVSWCPPVHHFAHEIVICTSGWRAAFSMHVGVLFLYKNFTIWDLLQWTTGSHTHSEFQAPFWFPNGFCFFFWDVSLGNPHQTSYHVIPL